MKELLIRTGVGAIAVSIVAGFILLGGVYLQFLMFAFVAIGAFEMKRAFSNLDININLELIYFLALVGQIEVYLSNSLIATTYLALFLTLMRFIFCKDISSVFISYFLSMYLILGFFSMNLIGNKIFVGLIFVISFATDSFAYISGILFGKHKLAPLISPNKSLEGSLGGLIGSILVTFIYLKFFSIGGETWLIITLAVLGSIIGQSGDLVASRIKRYTGIKDYGSLMPGHGGILDRFDSVLAVTPLIYLFYRLF